MNIFGIFFGTWRQHHMAHGIVNLSRFASARWAIWEAAEVECGAMWSHEAEKYAKLEAKPLEYHWTRLPSKNAWNIGKGIAFSALSKCRCCLVKGTGRTFVASHVSSTSTCESLSAWVAGSKENIWRVLLLQLLEPVISYYLIAI